MIKNVRRWTLLPLFCLLLGARPGFGQVAVIAHKSVPVDTITNLKLLEIYSGELRVWSNGERIALFDLQLKGETRTAFYKIRGKSASRMKSIWLVNMLSGEGDPPGKTKSEEEMLEKIAAAPGAIGFVSSQADLGEDVKTLFITE